MSIRMRRALTLSACAAAMLAGPAFAGTTVPAACNARTATQVAMNSPGMSDGPAAATSQSRAGVGSAAASNINGAMGATNSKGVKGVDGNYVSGTGTDLKGVKGLDGSYISGTGTQAVNYNGASVGGMGANGGNGELNMNNGGMAGSMDETNTGPTKINPKGGNAPQTDDHGNPMAPDGNYNWGGEWSYNHSDGKAGNPHDGQDSHGNTWKNGDLWNGTDGTKTMKNGVPVDGTADANGKRVGNYDPSKGHEPGADTGNNSGNDGTNAAGVAVNAGTHGGNDGGNGTGQGTSGNDGTNAAGQAFNGGGRVGSDAGLGAPKQIEAMNGAKLNNGVTDPCAGSMVH